MSKTSAPRGACVRVLGMTVYSFELMETERIAYRRRAVFPTWRTGPVFRLALFLGQALTQPGQHGIRDQPADVPAVLGDLLDQAGPQEGVERVGGHEQRLDLGHPVVHLRHLHLVLEVADGAQPLDHRGDPVGRAEVHQQAVEPLDSDVAVAAGDLAQHLDALVDREQAALGDVDQHRDDHLVVQARGAADDVEVTVGDRIKGTRTDYALHVVTPLLLFGRGQELAWSLCRVFGPRPYQKVASPYRRALSGTNPVGQLSGPDLVARSTITRAPGASQPCPASRARTRDTAASGSAYGGSANTTSYRFSSAQSWPPAGAGPSWPPAGAGPSWPPAGAGPRASTRSTLSAASTAPGRPIASMFSLIVRAALAPF